MPSASSGWHKQVSRVRRFDRIHAPIGLDIGAQGAAEIAVSIIAEITAVQRGKDTRP